MITKTWRSILTFVAGWWLVLSPWLLDYYSQSFAAWAAVIIGAMLMLSEMAAYVRPGAWEEMLDFVLGALLICLPLLPGLYTSTPAAINAVAVGMLVLGLAVHALMDNPNVQRWWHDHMPHAH